MTKTTKSTTPLQAAKLLFSRGIGLAFHTLSVPRGMKASPRIKKEHQETDKNARLVR
jgi:hypothetical protein